MCVVVEIILEFRFFFLLLAARSGCYYDDDERQEKDKTYSSSRKKKNFTPQKQKYLSEKWLESYTKPARVSGVSSEQKNTKYFPSLPPGVVMGWVVVFRGRKSQKHRDERRGGNKKKAPTPTLNYIYIHQEKKRKKNEKKKKK